MDFRKGEMADCVCNHGTSGLWYNANDPIRKEISMSLDGENLIRTEDYPTYDTRFSLEPALYFAFRDVRYPVPTEDGIFPEHVVAFYEIIVADRRPYCCRLDGKPLTVPPRDILVIKPWQKHSDIFQQDNGFYAVHFQIYSRQGKAVPFFAAGVTVEQQVIRHDENGHVQNLLEFLLRENKYTGNKDFLIQKYLFQADRKSVV